MAPGIFQSNGKIARWVACNVLLPRFCARVVKQTSAEYVTDGRDVESAGDMTVVAAHSIHQRNEVGRYDADI